MRKLPELSNDSRRMLRLDVDKGEAMGGGKRGRSAQRRGRGVQIAEIDINTPGE